MPKAPAATMITSEADVAGHLVPVILGADILGYSYVRCFHEAYGIRSQVLGSADVKSVSSSSFCDFHVVEGIDKEESLIAYLANLGEGLRKENKVGLLCGSGDWYARILSQHKAELEQWFAVPYIDFDLLDSITQKERFYAICEELDIPYPKTLILDCSADTPTVDAASLSYPLIAKPSNSAAYHYAEFPNKKKVFEVETPEELVRIHEALKGSCYDRELIVQDFIPGGDDGLRTLTFFSDAAGDVRVECSGRVVLQDHDPTAIGNPVCIMSDRVERAMEDGAKFLKHVGYCGFSNFDVKYDPRDGSYRFFEVNTRPGRNTFYMTQGGVNFVTLLVDEFVIGREIPKRVADKPFLYACIPPYVVKRTVDDVDLRERALSMYREGLAQFPMFYPADNASHRLWASITYYHQISKFKKYVWDTGGRQASVE